MVTGIREQHVQIKTINYIDVYIGYILNTIAPFNNLKTIEKEFPDALLEFNFGRHWVW